MELGLIGLGKMGAFMTERLVEAGHSVVGFDVDPDAVQRVVTVGASGAESIGDLVDQLDPPRAVWIMVPAGDPVDETIERLLPDLDDGDVIIDGGNSYYRDTLRRAEMCQAGGCHLVDVGKGHQPTVVEGRLRGYDHRGQSEQSRKSCFLKHPLPPR